MSLNVFGSENCRLFVSNDGVQYHRLPGVQSHSLSEGAINQRQTRAFEGTVSVLGSPDVPSIAVGALSNPQHPAWKIVLDGARESTELNWRLVVPPQIHFSRMGVTISDTVAVSAAGIPTFAGAAPNFGMGQTRFAEGMSLEVVASDLVYIFTDIGTAPEVEPVPTLDAAGGSITNPPAVPAVLAATPGYSIRTPSLQDAYDAVPSFPGRDVPAEGDIISSLTLHPRVLPPDPVVIKTQA